MTDWTREPWLSGGHIAVDSMREAGTTTLSREEQLCRWALRLLLPLILALCGQLIFWMWFDDIYGPNAWSIAGGCVLALVALPVGLWTWHSWLPEESDIPSAGSGTGLSKRSAFATLLTLLLIAGCADPNDAGSPANDVQVAQAPQGQAGSHPWAPHASPAISR
jgi:hypothetical protein